MKVVISAGGRGKELPIHHLLKLIVRLGGMPVIVHVIKGFVSQETYAICSRGWLPQNGPGRYFEGEDTEAGASAELIESRGIHESALLIHIWTPPLGKAFLSRCPIVAFRCPASHVAPTSTALLAMPELSFPKGFPW